MNVFAIIFLLITGVALLAMPRRWAPLPLLVGACYMTRGQLIMIGPFHFTVLRLLLLLGIIRILVRGERSQGGLITLDWLLLAWGAWLLCSSVFHNPVIDVLIFDLGEVYTTLGIYFLIRIFCQNMEDLIQVIRLIAFLLVPLAFEMLSETFTGHNSFVIFGGISETLGIREGKIRASGPFGHAILAGTVGAVCIPLMIGLWRQRARAAKIGLAACLTMMLTSWSTGPIMTAGAGVFALVLWRWRHLTRGMRIASVIGYLLLDLVMKDPAYFLLFRMNMVSGSTGDHRSMLIRAAFQHLNEWWWAGTDNTLHWMPYGLRAINQSDVTNQYLYYGVWGGLPLMFLFICLLWVAFGYVGQLLQLRARASPNEQFLIWCLGAGLFAHAVTGMSVAYFDQSVMFLYMNLAVIGSLYAATLATTREEICKASDSRNPDSDCGPGMRGRSPFGGNQPLRHFRQNHLPRERPPSLALPA